MTYVTANKNAKSEFIIPVTWQVFDNLKVQANSLEEAYDYVNENLDIIPLDSDNEYADGSYEISADDVDGCVLYQDSKEVICISFVCDDDLTKYTDSMLFDSTYDQGNSIAAGTFRYQNSDFDVALDVCGEVSVSFKGETYHRPSEFPDELIERIKNHPNDWECYAPSGEGNDDEESDIYVGLNNWFEYISDNGGDIFEDDLSKATPERILEDMMDIAKQYFGVSDSGCYGAGSVGCLTNCKTCESSAAAS